MASSLPCWLIHRLAFTKKFLGNCRSIWVRKSGFFKSISVLGDNRLRSFVLALWLIRPQHENCRGGFKDLKMKTSTVHAYVSSRPKWPFGDRSRRSLNAVQICRAALLAKIHVGSGDILSPADFVPVFGRTEGWLGLGVVIGKMGAKVRPQS